jgi:hypothetical protein
VHSTAGSDDLDPDQLAADHRGAGPCCKPLLEGEALRARRAPA